MTTLHNDINTANQLLRSRQPELVQLVEAGVPELAAKLDEALRTLQQIETEVAAIADALDAANVPHHDQAGAELSVADRVRLLSAPQLTPKEKQNVTKNDKTANVKLDINNIAPGRPCRLLVENVYDQNTDSVLLERRIVNGAYAIEVDGRIYWGNGSDFLCVDELLVGEHPKFSLVEARLLNVPSTKTKIESAGAMT